MAILDMSITRTSLHIYLFISVSFRLGMFLHKRVRIGLVVICDSSVLLVSSGRIGSSSIKFQLSAACQRLGNDCVDRMICRKSICCADKFYHVLSPLQRIDLIAR